MFSPSIKQIGNTGSFQVKRYWHTCPASVTFDAETNGGQMPDGRTSPDYYIGQPYGLLPQPTKYDEAFVGQYTLDGVKVTINDLAQNEVLVARYQPVTYATSFLVAAAPNQNKVGIYSAMQLNSTIPIIVDWGDGTQSNIFGNISQLTHVYNTTAYKEYTIKISDNISSIALMSSNSTWNSTTTDNISLVRKILNISENISNIPSYGFYNSCAINYIYAGSSGNLSLGAYAFSRCGNIRTASTLTEDIIFDFSGRSITSIPSHCFEACYHIDILYWPKNCKTIESTAFQSNWYSSDQHYKSFSIPEGITAIGNSAFYNCKFLENIEFPSTLSSISTSTFGHDSNLSSITSFATIAPTIDASTFGNSTAIYTGRNTYSAGTNKLYVPAGATGYDASYWGSVLLDSTKCGFTKEEIQQS